MGSFSTDSSELKEVKNSPRLHVEQNWGLGSSAPDSMTWLHWTTLPCCFPTASLERLGARGIGIPRSLNVVPLTVDGISYELISRAEAGDIVIASLSHLPW